LEVDIILPIKINDDQKSEMFCLRLDQQGMMKKTLRTHSQAISSAPYIIYATLLGRVALQRVGIPLAKPSQPHRVMITCKV
jgi:hypothetical protein